MRVSFVEVSGFRGFKQRTRFEIPAGFAVVTGRNGAGKSTLFDAIDFALTGTISKYDVKGAKGGGLESHIWWVGEGVADGHYVTIGFVDDNGREYSATRSRDRGFDSEERLSERICLNGTHGEQWAATLMQTTLIRDETLASLSVDLPQQARFDAVRAAIGALSGPDHTKRLDAVVSAASELRVRQDQLVQEATAELSRTLTALTEARSLAERQADISVANEIIQRVLPNADFAVRQPEQLLKGVAQRKQAAVELQRVLAQSHEYLLRMVAAQTEDADNGVNQLEIALLDARLALDAAETTLEARRVQLEAQEELDSFAASYAALIEHGREVGLQDHHCPLCDAVRTDAEFAAALEKAQARLEEGGKRVQSARTSFQEAAANADSLRATFDDIQNRLDQIQARRLWVEAEERRIEATYAQYGITARAHETDLAEREIARLQDETSQLEHALYILESSTAHDRVAALDRRAQELRDLIDSERTKLAAAEKAHETAKQIKNAAIAVGNEVLTEQFDTVMPLLKELYRRLRPHTDWREIETDFGGRIRATLNFTVGDGRNPQFLFSSGQRRAAGLAFLLAIHLSRPWCALRSLWLDDPVQHVDDYRALNLVEVLSSIRRSGRQVIVAVEDPALADLLCRRLRSSSEEPGRRFELATERTGSGFIREQIEIGPMPEDVLAFSVAS